MARRGQAYDYNLENQREARAAQQQQFAQSREIQNDRLKEAHENLRDALANQGARMKAATEAFQFSRDMTKMQREEKAQSDAAQFLRFYNMVKDNDPNRKGQINELLSQFPGAIKVPEIHQMLHEDNTRIDATMKPGLTPAEQKFLTDHGPKGAGGSKNSDYDDLQKKAGNPDDAAHVPAAITYGRVWDLMKKSVGMPSGTPQGQSIADYVKGVESRFEKLPNGQPNPAYQPPTGAVGGTQPPAPSTPAPQNAQGWAGADLTGQVAPALAPTPATAAPAATVAPAAPAAPAGGKVRDFLQSMGMQKTSDATPASPATGRNELNDLLNSSPETQFAAPNPSPTPTPPPAPKKGEEQYYTA